MTSFDIKLEQYRTTGSQVFTGRDRGLDVRKRSDIDSLIKKYDNIQIIIPADVYSINPSFLEEFLSNVVKSLGKKVFLDRIKFVSEGEYDIAENLEAAIDRILRKSNSLTS